MEIKRVGFTNFTGCRPPYKIPEGLVYPIERIATEMIFCSSATPFRKMFLEKAAVVLYMIYITVLLNFSKTLPYLHWLKNAGRPKPKIWIY